MEPRRMIKTDPDTGLERELGNAAAAAMLCVDPKTGEAIKSSTYQWYVANGKPASNRPPKHVEVDVTVTPPQRMYDLGEVREWQRRRRGRGNWEGIGAGARIERMQICPECGREVGVLKIGVFADHGDTQGLTCPRSGTAAPAVDATDD
jgi:hypothetical protein